MLPSDEDSLSEDIVSFHCVLDKTEQNQIKGEISFLFNEKYVYLYFDGKIAENYYNKKSKEKTLDKFEGFQNKDIVGCLLNRKENNLTFTKNYKQIGKTVSFIKVAN